MVGPPSGERMAAISVFTAPVILSFGDAPVCAGLLKARAKQTSLILPFNLQMNRALFFSIWRKPLGAASAAPLYLQDNQKEKIWQTAS